MLEHEAKHLVGDKPKCPFIPSRGAESDETPLDTSRRQMSGNINRVPEEVMELAYEDEWQPLEAELPDEPLALPRVWGRSTGREQKL